MESTSNRFYIYGDAHITISNNKQYDDGLPDNKGLCKICGWNYSGATSGLSGGDEWELCASCRFDQECAKTKEGTTGCWGYKTKACYRFKSTKGCDLGEKCTFLHDEHSQDYRQQDRPNVAASHTQRKHLTTQSRLRG